ncbi:MAG: SDR family oxidoreductase [Deltaproteobacteria bacterium]|nr:SDR family oxidoreductase [Deltaproteobacteria bacterium]
MKLESRVAILTAAAGAGIGQATARAIAREGGTVVITDVHPQRPMLVAQSIRDEYGVEALGMECDVVRRHDVDTVVRKTVETYGRVDILFNNAGTNRPAKIVEMSDEVWEVVVNTCLRGAFYSCRAVLPVMMKQNFGRIVNIASTAAFMGLDFGHSHYAAAKAGLIAFTRCLAKEAAPYYITANTIAPGFIFNEFIPHLYPEEEIERMQKSIPYPRKGVPEDVANTALFLMSDEGEYITGQTICVAGGSWMH